MIADAVRRHGAGAVVLKLPPWNAADLLGDAAPSALRRLSLPADGWGAFTVYVGLPSSCVPPGVPLHHQVLAGVALGATRVAAAVAASLADGAIRVRPVHRT